jgi:hypothetical protein
MTIFRCSVLALIATTAHADPITAPSGQQVTLYDVLLEPGIARFRYLAPAIDPAGQGLTRADVDADFIWLCQTIALPSLVAANKTADHVLIMLADREVDFGVATPEATQFIESYSVDGTTCIWDAF